MKYHRSPHFLAKRQEKCSGIINHLFHGLTYDTRGHFARNSQKICLYYMLNHRISYIHFDVVYLMLVFYKLRVFLSFFFFYLISSVLSWKNITQMNTKEIPAMYYLLHRQSNLKVTLLF